MSDSDFEATYGNILQSKKTGRQYEVVEWLNDDGGTEYMLKDILNDKVVMLTGDKLMKPSPDKRKLLSIEDINKIKADGVREAVTHSARLDSHQMNSYKAYEIMTDYANKLERGEL